MKEITKRPFGLRTIRFQDCDPYGHLNNAKYLDYMINVREDHLIHEYDVNVFAMAQKEQRSWLVGHNEIAYLKPANVMEEVRIETSLIDFTERYVKAEMAMLDKDATHVKAVLWTKFYHFDFKQGQGIAHDPKMISLFENIKIDVVQDSVEARARFLAKSLKGLAAVR
ncbi:acyl-CoA thioesterase [Roseivirga sp.]|uniref:acyl-CoA thioesterase n=1 Tax=Roseivirga sp. TaxID=1964215 RepID=UPI003B8E2BD7